MLKALAGKKTYLVAVAWLAYEVLGYLTGAKPTIDTQSIFEALGITALRAGVSKR